MTVKTGQTIAAQFALTDPTGALVAADALPTGVLVVAGVDNAAVVTITTPATGLYMWSVTLPTLTAGAIVQMRVAPVLYGVTLTRFVWADIADTKLTSDLNDLAAGAAMTLSSAYDAAKSAAPVGAAMTLDGAYDAAKSAAPVGAAMTLSSAYDAAKAAAPVGAAMALTSAYDAAKVAAPVGAAMTLTGAYDAAKVAAPVGAAMTLTSAYDAAKTAAQPGADGDTLKTLSDQIDHVQTLGTGATTWTYTLTSSVTGLPVADADVWVTTDLPGNNVIASGKTNANGVVTFHLDLGVVFVWRQKSGWNFTNPDQEQVV